MDVRSLCESLERKSDDDGARGCEQKEVRMER